MFVQKFNPDFGLGFFYLKKAHNIHYVIFFYFQKRLDNYDTLVYTYSVVNDKGDSIWCKRKREINTPDLWEVY